MDPTVRIEPDLGGVHAAQWDALDHGGSPFLEHGFLRALQESGSIGEAAGWRPLYVLVEHAGELVGAVAAFAKDHSYGEYIFDFGWARAAMRGGISYYPKLVIAAPVTPATGPRILLSPGLTVQDREIVVRLLIATVRELADELSCSSVHWLFCTANEHALLADAGFSPRASFQFHFHNPGYADFEAFLATLASRKRKQVRKERQRALAAIDGPLELVPGSAMTAADIASLDRFYRRTCRAHGGQDYLRPGFFEALVRHAPGRVRFARATQRGKPVAGALYLQTESALYGRYWGCTREIPLLHFETSYYAGIEHCIRERLPLFEAGAQGEHKLLRGFRPAATYSNHWIRHPGLRGAVERFLDEEAGELPRYMQELGKFSPYRKGDADACADPALAIEPAVPGEVGDDVRE